MQTESNLAKKKQSEIKQNKLLRWLERVSSTYNVMGRYNHPLSLDGTTMVSKNCPTIGEYVVAISVSQ